MKFVPSLVFACGCELVFPLRAPIDAPPAMCPTVGPPTFSQAARTFIGDSCNDYSPSPGTSLAIAVCNGVIEEGALDSDQLQPIVLSAAANHTISAPRLAPSGDELFVSDRDELASTTTIESYHRTADGQWVRAPSPIGFPSASGTDAVFPGPPTRGGAGRRIMLHQLVANQPMFSEWSDDGTSSWSLVHAYSLGMLGVQTMAFPSLTEDGLRLVFTANLADFMGTKIRYAERAAVTDLFPATLEIETVFSNTLHPYLTADCSRLYVVGISTVNFIDQ